MVLIERDQLIAIGLPARERNSVALGEVQLASELVFRKPEVAAETNRLNACTADCGWPLLCLPSQTRLMAEFVAPALVVEEQCPYRDSARRKVRRRHREPVLREIL